MSSLANVPFRSRPNRYGYGVISFIASTINSLDTAVWEVFVENPFLIDVAKVVTWFGTGAVLISVAVAVGVVVWWRTRDVLSAIIPWLTLQVCGVVIASMKNWTAVQRPPREFWLTTTDSFSFPSGHVGNTTALVASLVLLVYKTLPHYSRTSFAVGGLVCIAMAWSRLALNIHWMSDVVAGLLTGTAIAFLVARVAERFRSPRGSQPQTPGQRGG